LNNSSERVEAMRDVAHVADDLLHSGTIPSLTELVAQKDRKDGERVPGFVWSVFTFCAAVVCGREFEHLVVGNGQGDDKVVGQLKHHLNQSHLLQIDQAGGVIRQKNPTQAVRQGRAAVVVEPISSKALPKTGIAGHWAGDFHRFCAVGRGYRDSRNRRIPQKSAAFGLFPCPFKYLADGTL
jgi:hypothetical protein